MKTTWKHKLLSLLITAAMSLSLVATATVPAFAAVSDYIKVVKNDAFSKDGKFHMSFNVYNLTSNNVHIVRAKVFNSAGKEMFNWSGSELRAGESKTINYGADYRNLPTGKYTFKLYAIVLGNTYSWSYTLNHTKQSSFSFKSYETYYDSGGRYMHKFNIQCTGMKGQKLYCTIYDEYGNYVYSWGEESAVARKTNDEVGWFAWSGNVNGVRQPSGIYTVVITASGSSKTIEKTYNLKILEVPRG